MFLRSLKIENRFGVIREIAFRSGLNLIVDETPSGREALATGNNVGKTTVLKLIDVCLGSDPKRIFNDLENSKSEYLEVKNFLIETEVFVTLSICESMEAPMGNDVVIERNFLPRKRLIRRINGQNYSEQAFDEYLTNSLAPGHYGKKPTFRQIISHNIRYKEPGVSNTLRTLDGYTRDDEYEALYLFLFGCDFDQGNEKQNLLIQLRTELAFKARLEARQTKSAYEISLLLVMDEIRELEVRRAAFKQSADLERKVGLLGDLKYRKSAAGASLTRLRLRRSLVSEAVQQIRAQRSTVDVAELRALYDEVSGQFGELAKRFEDLVGFHNQMVQEKSRYIAKDLPNLDSKISSAESDLRSLTFLERKLLDELADAGTFEEMESTVLALNDRHRRRGEYETVITQISDVDASLAETREALLELGKGLFSEEALRAIQVQLAKFNRFFSTVSEELYGEKYALKVDSAKNKNGQQIYKFSCFNTNFSSGKKQGEIICFDIAYTLFAEAEGLPCYHFLLNDRKELMHDNQLELIGRLVERYKNQIQLVASILRDKLPDELNREEYFVVKLSQADKLFRVETGGRPPLEGESG